MTGENKILVESIDTVNGRGLVVTGKVVEGTIYLEMKCIGIDHKENQVKEIRLFGQTTDYLRQGQKGEVVLDGIEETDLKGRDTLTFI